MLGNNAVFIVTQEANSGYESHIIDKEYLQSHIPDFSRHFYLCGPDKMVADLSETLVSLGASPEAVVFEK
jgi:ferredoxin-NADP reductase